MAYKFHTLAAIAVLIVSGVWVATGTFSSVGSATHEPDPNLKAAAAEAKSPKLPPDPAVALRTVAFVKPIFVDHNRKIRVAGITQADKRVTLAVRTSGIIASLKVQQGDKIEKDGLVLSLEAEDKVAMVTTAKAILAQRQTEFDATSQLVLRGSSAKMQEDTARSALATAKSQLQQAMAEIDRLQIKAPFSGVIDRVLRSRSCFSSIPSSPKVKSMSAIWAI
jgi:membrane fusion protein, multidrug efflux system